MDTIKWRNLSTKINSKLNDITATVNKQKCDSDSQIEHLADVVRKENESINTQLADGMLCAKRRDRKRIADLKSEAFRKRKEEEVDAELYNAAEIFETSFEYRRASTGGMPSDAKWTKIRELLKEEARLSKAAATSLPKNLHVITKHRTSNGNDRTMPFKDHHARHPNVKQ